MYLVTYGEKSECLENKEALISFLRFLVVNDPLRYVGLIWIYFLRLKGMVILQLLIIGFLSLMKITSLVCEWERIL